MIFAMVILKLYFVPFVFDLKFSLFGNKILTYIDAAWMLNQFSFRLTVWDMIDEVRRCCVYLYFLNYCMGESGDVGILVYRLLIVV